MKFHTLVFCTAMFAGCSAADPCPQEVLTGTHASGEVIVQRGRRTAEKIAKDFLAFVRKDPQPDVYQRYLPAMAKELVEATLTTYPDPNPDAKITCSGEYENINCWNVNCSCDTLWSCGTLSTWCANVQGQSGDGISCSKKVTGGCP